jgi:hypothetical protein
MILTDHFNALVHAGADEEILHEYSALLQFLRARRGKPLEAPVTSETKHNTSTKFTENEIRSASLEKIAQIICDETSSRKDLEFVAIHRFSVPKGSMRSFSNRKMLVDKLQVLAANEKAHVTIGEVARGLPEKS